MLPFFFRLSNGVDGHDPNDRDPEIFEIIEARLDAAEVACGREGAWVELVDNSGFDPVRGLVRRGLFGALPICGLSS